MREIISNDVKSWIVNDTTMLHFVRMGPKKFTVVRVGEKSSSVEQLSAKEMTTKYKVKAW